MANFDHTACYRDGLHPPTKAGRQQCRTSGPASRMGTRTNPPTPAPSPPTAPRDETAAVEVRQRRAAAAERYRPDRVRLLLVAQAPPDADDRYFYFTDVATQDSLFRSVARAILPHTEPTRDNKASLLAQLRDRGVFLIDLKPDPVDGSPLSPCVPALLARIAELAPERIILIKADVHDVAYPALAAASLPVSKVRIPFPSSGRQKEFAEAFGRALAGE
ncbi:Uncharacterised protein [Mycobacteroides abscessus subsp. abscessus]|uniref:hypothetical protein n=1 Tax=Mycobacteroides abscessus TaxID=36809 RepID=UPI0009269CD2|nr:hypothetical protein [Mycobacteroides abscessus]MBE5513769.1 hypothetical protein [Mycobacteroides abscessus]SID61937.1 Uncharacterised protein [Mycobacteroides abscessus subsp. abscessus]SIE83721.1 Uncharacterised protein [Mycobacteroides abscessus subsp. abscessus]SIF72233.1 Uncharacterised protein [Mycobacteroides abscessus subsp. abscessus]SIF74581.1 Uncharacterised protein [Mycobacteroides abscessus subsp. abscessus]